MAATEAVTTRMLAAWTSGAIGGFSVLANGRALGRLCHALKEESKRPARIAAHLNLSEGPPCAAAPSVAMLVDADGELNQTFGSLLRTWLRADAARRVRFLDQVRSEWRAQIERLRAALPDRSLAALDGHMHVHMLPFLFPIAADLAKEFGIPQIRISRESLYLAGGLRDLANPAILINFVKHAVLRMCARFAEPAARERGLTWPDRIVGVIYSGCLSAEAAKAGVEAARRDGASEVEVVFHVGRAVENERDRWGRRDFMSEFYLSPQRDLEFEQAEQFNPSGRMPTR